MLRFALNDFAFALPYLAVCALPMLGIARPCFTVPWLRLTSRSSAFAIHSTTPYRTALPWPRITSLYRAFAQAPLRRDPHCLSHALVCLTQPLQCIAVRSIAHALRSQRCLTLPMHGLVVYWIALPLLGRAWDCTARHRRCCTTPCRAMPGFAFARSRPALRGHAIAVFNSAFLCLCVEMLDVAWQCRRFAWLCFTPPCRRYASPYRAVAMLGLNRLCLCLAMPYSAFASV